MADTDIDQITDRYIDLALVMPFQYISLNSYYVSPMFENLKFGPKMSVIPVDYCFPGMTVGLQLWETTCFIWVHALKSSK